MATLLFHGGQKNEQNVALEPLIQALTEAREILHGYSVFALIAFFDALVTSWKTDVRFQKYVYIKNLTDFFSAPSLISKLHIALHGDERALDTFVDLGDPTLFFHAQPRGLTVHWLAGNVAILGLFSIFSALVTKNPCLVKASSRGYEDLLMFLNAVTQIKTVDIDGATIAKSIAVLLVPHEDIVTHRMLSHHADVRIAWGGREAIETITMLPKQLHCEDIIFGPKYSYAVIDHESLVKHGKQLAQRLALDVAVFDQYACSSPHTVFIHEKSPGEVLQFAEELSRQLDLVGRTMIPKGPIDSKKAMEILELRLTAAMTGKVFCSKGTEWTVIVSNDEGLAQGWFSRVIVVKPLRHLQDLAQWNDRQKQTLGVALTMENKMTYLDMITRRGIDRCPRLGYLTFYESPWDGMFVFDRLVRWVSMAKGE